MILHIFNPEHDMALACNRRHFTLPHTIQEFRTNLGWMPALWAHEGDAVLVDDANYAVKAWKKFGLMHKNVRFVEKEQVKDFVFDRVEPWGWDLALYTFLKDIGAKVSMFPDEDYITGIRELSNRRITSELLPFLRDGIKGHICGESVYVTSLAEVSSCIDKWQNIVVKAPWSSSGRGIKYVDSIKFPVTERWIDNVIRRQGGVMVEPLYRKIIDFGMEFHAMPDNSVCYCGLSLFQTVNGAYKGNLLTTEKEKMDMLCKYLPEKVLVSVRENICKYMQRVMAGKYSGAFGVDMMVVAQPDGDGFLLHPCVEVNVRNTMGHVALCIPVSEYEPKRLFQIIHNVNFQLKVSTLGNNFVETI